MKRYRDDVFVSSQIKRPAISPRLEQYVFLLSIVYLDFDTSPYFGTKRWFFGVIVFIAKYLSWCRYHALVLLRIAHHWAACFLLSYCPRIQPFWFVCVHGLFSEVVFVFNHLPLDIHEPGCYVSFFFRGWLFVVRIIIHKDHNKKYFFLRVLLINLNWWTCNLVVPVLTL